MSALLVSLAFAALFILFCALPRRGTGCVVCEGQEADLPSCPGCPYASGPPAPTEGEGE